MMIHRIKPAAKKKKNKKVDKDEDEGGGDSEQDEYSDSTQHKITHGIEL